VGADGGNSGSRLGGSSGAAQGICLCASQEHSMALVPL